MTSPILGILAALGGGASGAASGLKTIDEMHTSQEQEDLRKRVAEANISGAREQREIERSRASNEQLHYQDMLEQQRQQTILAQRQLDRMIASEQNAAQRQVLEDERKRLTDFQTNLERLGVGALDPQMAYQKLSNPLTPQTLAAQGTGAFTTAGGISPPQMKALGAMINTTGQNIGNMPQKFIPGSEQYGGLIYKGHPFNPNTGQSDALLGARRQAQYSRMLTQSMTNIQNAYRNAYSSYAANPTIAKLIGSVDEQMSKRGRDAADAAAKQQVMQTAQGALNTLRSAFPDESAGLTPEALIGTVDFGGQAGGPAGSGPPPLGGNPSTPGAQSPPAPSLNFNPNDPLSIGRPMKVGPGAAPITPVPPKKPNDPLNFGRP